MQNRPTAEELMKGVVHFLERDVVPALQEPLRFHTRVAANLLKIIQRERDLKTEHLQKEKDRLVQILGPLSPSSHNGENLITQVTELNEMLCQEIQAGRADHSPLREQVMNHVRKTLSETLEITNPRLLSKKSTPENG